MIRHRIASFIGLISVFGFKLFGQVDTVVFLSLASFQDESEWRFHVPKPEEEISSIELERGYLRKRWTTDRICTDWDCEFGETRGFVRLKWKNKANDWEARFGNEYLSFAPIWRGQFDQWRVEWKGKEYKIKLELDNDGIAYVLFDQKQAIAQSYNRFFGEFEDWIIETNGDVSPEQILVLSFISIYYGLIINAQ